MGAEEFNDEQFEVGRYTHGTDNCAFGGLGTQSHWDVERVRSNSL